VCRFTPNQPCLDFSVSEFRRRSTLGLVGRRGVLGVWTVVDWCNKHVHAAARTAAADAQPSGEQKRSLRGARRREGNRIRKTGKRSETIIPRGGEGEGGTRDDLDQCDSYPGLYPGRGHDHHKLWDRGTADREGRRHLCISALADGQHPASCGKKQATWKNALPQEQWRIYTFKVRFSGHQRCTVPGAQDHSDRGNPMNRALAMWPLQLNSKRRFCFRFSQKNLLPSWFHARFGFRHGLPKGNLVLLNMEKVWIDLGPPPEGIPSHWFQTPAIFLPRPRQRNS